MLFASRTHFHTRPPNRITPFSTISKRVFNLYIGIYALKYHPLGGNENLTIPSFSSRIPKKSWG
uniref:Uncharacterized protein n=1 Tax=Populus trichocarpa TaxID=3694 RepID=A0A2K2BPY4_POPTR